MQATIHERLQQGLVPVAGRPHACTACRCSCWRRDELLPTVKRLKDEFGFDLFLDVTAVDWLGQVPRFELVYHFYSSTHHVRVRLKARVDEADAERAVADGLYGSAAFMERECHDMYGIRFDGNADLRPILLYEGFVGHPLRKDYPKLQEQPLVPYRS